ncbi:MAG TPA: carbon-nitrogen hydrolase family protein [bacterium]|nr:carbon-nitrogen hydrolase family protein [bacterium]HQP98935.1 carbon-nitrogen hydrolase family protein [bacterium]
MEIRIAFCQILCIDGDREGDFVRIENALREARHAGAEIACFPEMCLLGWVNPEAHQLAYPIPGEDSDRLGDLASRYNMMIAVGLGEKDGDLLYDSAVLIDRDGSLLLKHRKINILTELMKPPYTPGNTIRAVETRFGRIGILICADTFIEEHLIRMKEAKPDLVIVPYGWAAKKDEWPEHGRNLQNTVSKAARVIGAPVVGTDLVGCITHGPWSGYTYGGQSVVCDASGEVLALGCDRDRDIVIVRVSLPNR